MKKIARRLIAAFSVVGVLVAAVSVSASTSASASPTVDSVLADVSPAIPLPGLSLQTVSPVRLLDTRTSIGGHMGVVPAGGVVTLTIPGSPDDASAVAVNLTAVNGTGTSFLVAYAAGAAVPETSNLNWNSGGAVANSAVVSLSADKKISVRNKLATVNVIVDLIGYYTPAVAGPAGPVGPTGATGLPGPIGPIGDTGPAGADGAKGDTGDIGAVGPAGPAGDTGPAGADGAKGDTGAPGPVGPQGEKGDTGADGADGADGAKGDTGAPGPVGPQGTDGAKGDKGDKGDTGQAGVPGAGAILAASSGGPVVVSTALGGLVGTVATLPLSGSDAQTAQLIGPVLDATTVGNEVQVFPRDGTVTSISARFSTTVPLSLIGTTATITAQLYASNSGDNTLTPVPGALCNLTPSLTGLITIGTVLSCVTTGLNIPVSAQTAAVMVVSATSTGGPPINTFTGYASTSLSVD